MLEILRDADMLDGMGVVGLMRAISSMNMISLYNSFEVKGETWGLGREGFDKLIDENGPKMNNIVEQINFQISWQENLKTKTAKKCKTVDKIYEKIHTSVGRGGER